MERNVYSVKQINAYIKAQFDGDIALRNITVRGEISNCSYYENRYRRRSDIYFSLKDDDGLIQCVMYDYESKGLSFRPENGKKVDVTGSISVYVKRGEYKLYAQNIRFTGDSGNRYEKLEALKKELKAKGLFDAPKKSIPAHPKKIGIVTAPGGAVLRDICTTARNRNPYVQLILFPVAVQGNEAAPSIVQGIQVLDRCGVDAIIVGRGGGSIEDLWAFNEESVAYAIFQCRTPVISAVGHETDVTIADFVADVRVATPTAAAVCAVDDVRETLAAIADRREQLEQRMQAHIFYEKKRLENLRIRLEALSPQNQLREKHRLLREKQVWMKNRMEMILQEKKHQMLLYRERLQGMSPQRKLEQGFSYVADTDGRTITSIRQVDPGKELDIYVTDGVIRVNVAGVKKRS